jgi:hypothetical protein
MFPVALKIVCRVSLLVHALFPKIHGTSFSGLVHVRDGNGSYGANGGGVVDNGVCRNVGVVVGSDNDGEELDGVDNRDGLLSLFSDIWVCWTRIERNKVNIVHAKINSNIAVRCDATGNLIFTTVAMVSAQQSLVFDRTSFGGVYVYQCVYRGCVTAVYYFLDFQFCDAQM